jgi:structural maintenance of chromosome 2
LDQKVKEFEASESKHKALIEDVKSTEELLQTLTTGMCAQEGHESGYVKQLQGIFCYLTLYDLNFSR